MFYGIFSTVYVSVAVLLLSELITHVISIELTSKHNARKIPCSCTMFDFSESSGIGIARYASYRARGKGEDSSARIEWCIHLSSTFIRRTRARRIRCESRSRNTHRPLNATENRRSREACMSIFVRSLSFTRVHARVTR